MDSIDGMLEADDAVLRDRVTTLERKVQSQEDDIICLKSALSDCLRRLSTLEASAKAAPSSSAALPSRPQVRSASAANRKSASMRDLTSQPPASARRSVSGSGDHMTLSGASRAPPSPTPSRTGARHPPPIKKWSSTTDSSGVNGTRVSSSNSSKEHTFNSEDGSLKFYMRGRPTTLYAPSNIENYQIDQTDKEPAEKLRLEWVYGYRGRDARSNIHYLPTGEMVYFTAAVVVLYNVEEQMQRHYLGHTDDVKCIAVHSDKFTIATGQVAGHDKKEGKPHIRIWNSVSLNTLHIIGIGDFDRAVACVAFSKVDGEDLLVAVDESNEHCISLWNWRKGERGQRIAETKSSTEPVLAVEFHPVDKNVVVTCGKNQISFWNIDGGTLNKKQGIFEKHEKPKFVTCIGFTDSGDVLSGDSNGNIYVWGSGTNRISQSILGVHDGAIFSICVVNDGSFLTGGKDRRVVQWNADYQKSGSEHEIPEEYGGVRMISQGKGSLILVGTTRNCILIGSLDLKMSAIVRGHMDELWGLTPRGANQQFISVGYDKTLYMWDALSHSAVWSMEIPEGGHCVAVHPVNVNIAAVGTQTSKWIVIDLETREVIHSQNDGNEQIECIAFSPDGNRLALGSRDNFVYVYQVSEEGQKYKKTGRCSGHSSFITHLDWSLDGEFLQTNSGDYELLFWKASSCTQVTSAASMRDIVWASLSCTLTFNSCGIWPEGADGTDVNACVRSNKQTLMASADDFGKVNLFTYPACQPKSNGSSYSGHSSHVTNVQFLNDDSRLLSAGGKDTAILQWEIIG